MGHEGISVAGGVSLSHPLNGPTVPPFLFLSRPEGLLLFGPSRLVMEVAPVRPGPIPGGGAATGDGRWLGCALEEPQRSGGRR